MTARQQAPGYDDAIDLGIEPSATAHEPPSDESDSGVGKRPGARWVPTLVTLLFVSAVEFATRVWPLTKSSLPPPTAVFLELAHQVQRGNFWVSLGHTMQGWAAGLLLALLFAVPLGLLLGTTPWLFQSMKFILDFVRPIPSIALLPLFILLFGLSLTLKIYITALGAFFPLLFQTLYGVQDVDPVARDTARAYRLKPIMRFVFIDLMGATPYIATGLRIAASVALVVSVATELLVGVPGLGADVFKAQNSGHIDTMYALIVATGTVGLLVAIVFGRIERATMHWHPSQRSENPS
jgi:ABC-type nitrate/sulfonate/bicarbonate transport system permease component